MNRDDKMKQIKKEAKSVAYAMILIVIFWIISGLCVSRFDIFVYHTPLWVITGCLGTWVFAIGIVVWLVRHVFKNFSLDDTKETGEDE